MVGRGVGEVLEREPAAQRLPDALLDALRRLEAVGIASVGGGTEGGRLVVWA